MKPLPILPDPAGHGVVRWKPLIATLLLLLAFVLADALADAVDRVARDPTPAFTLGHDSTATRVVWGRHGYRIVTRHVTGGHRGP